MDANISPLERAFELARSGKCSSIDDIKNQMKSEGYSPSQIEGRSLRTQLRALIDKAKGTASG